MPRTFDPLACIPSTEAIRRKLNETERLAGRLRILLNTAEAIERADGNVDADCRQARQEAER